MRTEKQIQILKEQKGNELKKQINELDSIYIKMSDYDDYNKYFKDIKENENLTYIPILKKGVFIAEYESFYGYIIFNIEFKKEKTVIKTNIFNDQIGICCWDCDIYCEIPFASTKHLDYKILEYSDARTEVYLRQKRGRDEIKKYIDKKIEDACKPLNLFLEIICLLNWFMQHPEIKEVKQQEKTRQKAKQNNDKQSINNTIKINNIKIKTNNAKIIKSVRKNNRIAEKWGVRGHFRHYKNGKVIYIKPYEKGTGEKNTKKYIL